MYNSVLLTLVIVAISTFAQQVENDIIFPKGFVFGTATAAYQIEGAVKQDDRGPSIWDVFSHTPNKTYRGETGDVACDHYNRLEQDIALMKRMNLKYYRMSFSWSRLLPMGTLEVINEKGVAHYNREINLLLENGITPFVTLYHWDLPQVLHEKFGGWLDTPKITKAFGDYADFCFSRFGDRVKHWITFNEAWCTSVLGYLNGVHAPGRCTGCSPESGNSSTEPYRVAHSQILSHATAVNIYRTKYKSKQNGIIGMTMNSDWNEPYSQSDADVQAAQRAMEFGLGWFADPIIKGEYPASMRERAGNRIPQFTAQEKNLLLSAKSDFFGLNHYSTQYTGAPRDNNKTSNADPTYFDDQHVWNTHERDGKQIGPVADSPWLYVVPWGARKILNWIKNRYPGLDIYITENGCDVPNEDKLPLQEALNDTFRLNYIRDYLTEISKAVNEDHVPLKGYFVWSFMDNYEWADGYRFRFGIHYTDYKTQTRYAKASSKWYANLIKNY
jgi:beta-glucosidase/6-phospho-beta-glucosidase/beta-galactosidase